MTEDKPIVHFGNYYRWLFPRRGQLASACRKADLNATYVAGQLARLPDPSSIMPDMRTKLLKAANVFRKEPFASWEDLDAAWQKTPMRPFPKRFTGVGGGLSLVEVGDKPFHIKPMVEVAEDLKDWQDARLRAVKKAIDVELQRRKNSA